MLSEKEILSHLITLGQEIAQVKDVDLLLEKILAGARRFVNADAGSIYIKSDDRLIFGNAQNNTLQRRLPPGKKLIYAIFSVPVNDTSIAGHVAGTGEMVNIPDVYRPDQTLPCRFDSTYDDISCYRTKSVLAFPLKTPQNEILGVLQLINAMDAHGNIIPFSKDDEPYIMHFAHSAAIALERAQMTRAIILRMLRMAEMRDPSETGAHVNRVGAYAAELYEAWARRSGVPEQEMEKTKDVLRVTAMLHDVGKVAISDIILKKPARLDVNEFEEIKHHTFWGARLFADSHSEFDRAAFHVALEHHERWDGQGYPGHMLFESGGPMQVGRSKQGEEINLFARIVAVADVYDALSSRRCYKDAWDESRVLAIMREESGRQFDPGIIEVFFDVLDHLRAIKQQHPDTGAGQPTAG
jgi:HD-GYP domain-containing protein (c-di-GMP phosphodiesterase class II)